MNMDLVFPDDVRDARAHSDRNLSEVERWASIAAGAGLALYGLTRLKSAGWLYAGIGGLLLRRGVTAHCDLYEAVGMNTAHKTSAIAIRAPPTSSIVLCAASRAFMPVAR